MRNAEINRKTAETDIALKLELDGKGESNIDTGVGFLDHMLTLFAKHGRRTSASLWGKPSRRPWGIRKASTATAAPSSPWMSPSS